MASREKVAHAAVVNVDMNMKEDFTEGSGNTNMMLLLMMVVMTIECTFVIDDRCQVEYE